MFAGRSAEAYCLSPVQSTIGTVACSASLDVSTIAQALRSVVQLAAPVATALPAATGSLLSQHAAAVSQLTGRLPSLCLLQTQQPRLLIMKRDHTALQCDLHLTLALQVTSTLSVRLVSYTVPQSLALLLSHLPPSSLSRHCCWVSLYHISTECDFLCICSSRFQKHAKIPLAFHTVEYACYCNDSSGELSHGKQDRHVLHPAMLHRYYLYTIIVVMLSHVAGSPFCMQSDNAMLSCRDA